MQLPVAFPICHLISKVCISLAAPCLLCVCAGFVFMTTPVIRRCCGAAGVNTAEVHYTHCCFCFYLAPGCFQWGCTSEPHAELSMQFITHTHNHTQFDFIQMLSLQPPCDQLSTMKPRAGPMLGRRWLVRDAITAAAITFSATESEQQFNVLVSRISNPQPVAAGALHEPDFVPVSRLVTLTTCLNNLQACGVSTIICS